MPWLLPCCLKITGTSKKSLEQQWTEVCEQAFQTLKSKLVSTPVLVYADFKKSFILDVDASHHGLGAVLSQEQDGKIRPIAYASRRTEKS